jgi:hypothetical protein
MKHPIGHSRNGIAVHVDLIQSQAAKHISQQPHLLNLIAEALQQTSLSGPNPVVERDMGRPVGYNFVVKTSGTDTVFYAQVLRDDTYTRFIKNGKPNSTQYLSMLLHKNADNEYDLVDAWIGRLSPPRPGTSDENAESKPFWESHAIILGNESLQLRTVTKVCPY